MLLEFKDIFALLEDELGLTHLLQHDTDMGKSHPHHLPLAHQADADSAICEEASITEPSDSLRTSGVGMVKKEEEP